MRNVETHLLEDKMDEAVTHYINSHQATQPVHLDANGIPLNVQDDGGGRVTIMHQQTYTTQMCRQISVGEQVGDGPWGEELLEGPIAAIVAQLQNRTSHHHPTHHHKMPQVIRSDVDTVILDGSMRYTGQTLVEQQTEPIVVQLPPMPTLPPLQDMKRCAETDWFTNKNKKDGTHHMLPDSDSSVLEMASASPAHNKQQSRKSLPHKKRISRKLKRNTGNSTPQQQELVVINCSEPVVVPSEHEQILPDNYAHAHHISHEVRSMFICQICGDYYGEEQLKFYHHLKQHYEPHTTIIIENPVTDLAMDKMTSNCIVDNVATLPDSIVELSLEETVPKTMYQPIDKHILYTSSEKTLNYNSNKVQIPMEKDNGVMNHEAEKGDLYEGLDKFDLYNCGKCTRTFRKQKQCEAHMREAHGSKVEEMGEFSEPEDLMAGIQVCVDGEPYLALDHQDHQDHQDHARHWLGRGCGPSCAVCARAPLKLFKEEVLQRIFDGDVSDNANFADNMIQESDVQEHEQHSHEPHENSLEQHQHPDEHSQEHAHEHSQRTQDNEQNDNRNVIEKTAQDAKPAARLQCGQCERVFSHRNSLLYHALSHVGKRHPCRDCGKAFYTAGALKIHRRLHSDDKPCKCEECGRQFRQWSDLKYHQMSKHSNEKKFKCEFCGKSFARKYSLNVHTRIHTGERNYKCDHCGKGFRASCYRLAHMRTHTGSRPYKCEQCEKCFRSSHDLRRHMLVHEKDRNRLEEQKQKDDARKTKMADTKEIKIESPPKKKLALASTTKPPNQTPSKKGKKAKKSPKKGAPNVTLESKDIPFKTDKEYPTTVESENRLAFTRYKDVYSENDTIKPQIVYGNENSNCNLAILKPIGRGPTLSNVETDKPVHRENTDGKLQVFTHVEKKKDYNGPIMSNSLGDIRHLERDVAKEVRSELSGEVIETAFLERLTALYNIPAV